MKRHLELVLVVLSLFTLAAQSYAGVLKVLTNHLGYDTSGPKHAVILGKATDSVSACLLRDEATDQVVLAITPKATGPVQRWRDWYFWTLDFDSFVTEGKYYLECTTNAVSIRSFPFLVQSDLLERSTVSDVIYYFKDERSSGEMDKADSHLRFEGTKAGTIDAHGGWWDATGDYGKHFSHLSFSTYFNPQQIPLVVYSLLKSYEQANRRNLQGFARYKTRLLDEAMFGADYLVRMKVPEGSFYRSVSTGSVNRFPKNAKLPAR